MKELYIEFAKKFGIAVAIFAIVFVALAIGEHCLGKQLMTWSSPAFVIGFVASIIGVAYVLTVSNPKNYLGFYGGIVMATLLAVQFWLNKQFDLVVLYLAVFIPFLTRSIVVWKRGMQKRKKEKGRRIEENELEPAWLSKKALLITILIAVAILVADYALCTRVIYKDMWTDRMLIKLLGAGQICSSALAHYWLIHKKTDAWIWWVIYSVVGIVFYAILPEPNIFLVVLSIVFLIVNGSALIAWIKITPRHV
ncbi:MAG: nicotinamide mononucleotide transporter family protein [Paludibacteraceae bacterium]|nr:nicotinamide mononucleotide transporter family protein [Paludibacteraceae bacterium]